MMREHAFELVKENVKNERLVKHMLAVEAIMGEMARFLHEDVEKWSLVGLLHDVDCEKSDATTHGSVASKILEGKVNEEIINCIKAHNFENTKVIPKTKMEIGLIAADAVSGLIIATALVMPSKRLGEVKLETLKRKFKQKDFARACNRNKILICEKIGIPLETFLELALNALKKISYQLGM